MVSLSVRTARLVSLRKLVVDSLVNKITWLTFIADGNDVWLGDYDKLKLTELEIKNYFSGSILGIPQCPFVATYINKHSDYEDLI